MLQRDAREQQRPQRRDDRGKLAGTIAAARLIEAPCGALENLLHRTIADANDAAAQLIGVDVPAPE